MNRDFTRGVVAVLAGCVVIFMGDTLLGVQIEMFAGIATFTFPWMLDVFLVPFIAGLAVALIYKERSGKWLAFLPPVIVRCLNCYYLYLTNEYWNADFFYHLHLHYWGMAVVLTFQASYIGGMVVGVLNGSYLRNNDSASNSTCGKPAENNTYHQNKNT